MDDNLKNATTRSGAKFEVKYKVSDMRGDKSNYEGWIEIDDERVPAIWRPSGQLIHLERETNPGTPTAGEMRNYSLVVIEKIEDIRVPRDTEKVEF